MAEARARQRCNLQGWTVRLMTIAAREKIETRGYVVRRETVVRFDEPA